MKDKDGQDQAKGCKREKWRITWWSLKWLPAVQRMDTETLNIGEPFFCYALSQVSQESKTGSVTVNKEKEMKDKSAIKQEQEREKEHREQTEREREQTER